MPIPPSKLKPVVQGKGLSGTLGNIVVWSSKFLLLERIDRDTKFKSTISVKVKVSENLAVHERIDLHNHQALPGYSITHIPTTTKVVHVKAETDAIRIAEYLLKDSAVCKGLEEDDREEVANALPSWVVPWLKKCYENQGWVDPQPFEQEYC